MGPVGPQCRLLPQPAARLALGRGSSGSAVRACEPGRTGCPHPQPHPLHMARGGSHVCRARGPPLTHPPERSAKSDDAAAALLALVAASPLVPDAAAAACCRRVMTRPPTLSFLSTRGAAADAAAAGTACPAVAGGLLAGVGAAAAEEAASAASAETRLATTTSTRSPAALPPTLTVTPFTYATSRLIMPVSHAPTDLSAAAAAVAGGPMTTGARPLEPAAAVADCQWGEGRMEGCMPAAGCSPANHATLYCYSVHTHLAL